MKKFQTLEFDRITYERELNEFNQLLSNNQTLSERTIILPFTPPPDFLGMFHQYFSIKIAIKCQNPLSWLLNFNLKKTANEYQYRC